MIIDAYVRIRQIDNNIPDDVLDFMKTAAVEKLNKKTNTCDECGKLLENGTVFCSFNCRAQFYNIHNI